MSKMFHTSFPPSLVFPARFRKAGACVGSCFTATEFSAPVYSVAPASQITRPALYVATEEELHPPHPSKPDPIQPLWISNRSVYSLRLNESSPDELRVRVNCLHTAPSFLSLPRHRTELRRRVSPKIC